MEHEMSQHGRPTPSTANTAFNIHAAGGTSSTSFRPPAGVFETLVEQHRRVLEQLVEASSSQAVSTRQERWADARRRLLSHERAEMRVVYARLQDTQGVGSMLEQHTQQAAELETAIQELDATDAASDLWIERLRDVMVMLADHVQDEEQDFFPRAQRLLGENTARELDEPFISTQRDLLHELQGPDQARPSGTDAR
jgi:hemerythrin superfamily protein